MTRSGCSPGWLWGVTRELRRRRSQHTHRSLRAGLAPGPSPSRPLWCLVTLLYHTRMRPQQPAQQFGERVTYIWVEDAHRCGNGVMVGIVGVGEDEAGEGARGGV